MPIDMAIEKNRTELGDNTIEWIATDDYWIGEDPF
jgi:hypothetical protein